MSTRLFPLPLVALMVLAAPALAQGTGEQRAACTGDAMRLCLSSVPDVGRITACMKSHYGELSPRCQASFHEEKRSEPPHKLAEEPAKAPSPAPVVKQAEAPPPAAAPHVAAREAPRERIVPREPAPHPRLARVLAERAPVDRAPAEHRAVAHHRRDSQAPRDVASRELPARDLPSRDLPSRDLPAGPAVPYPAEPPLADRAPPYPAIAGGPITEPPLVTGLSATTSDLAAACRQGLIDSYTCGNTLRTLGLRE